MASITTMNIGGTSYTINDARVSTSAVTTATHLLATNAGVTAINPITAANLASVLGAVYPNEKIEKDTPDTLTERGMYLYQNSYYDEKIGHNLAGFFLVLKDRTGSTAQQYWILQVYIPVGVSYLNVWVRVSVDNGKSWRVWRKLSVG